MGVAQASCNVGLRRLSMVAFMYVPRQPTARATFGLTILPCHTRSYVALDQSAFTCGRAAISTLWSPGYNGRLGVWAKVLMETLNAQLSLHQYRPT